MTTLSDIVYEYVEALKKDSMPMYSEGMVYDLEFIAKEIKLKGNTECSEDQAKSIRKYLNLCPLGHGEWADDCSICEGIK